ncbi:hypothetical protein CB1_001566004 [Camelus ferus]|nr:hypothetical protein CB1_001566004 [Camelus ferus]
MGKGKLDMCKLLLRHGADVNCHQHEHGYTALMFAALSGNKDITWVMLEAGAETDVVNSVGRTAAQMAAFVDSKLDVNSNCVNEEQPEAEEEAYQEDCNPGDSVEGGKESLQSDAGLGGLQEAPASPQVSEE